MWCRFHTSPDAPLIRQRWVFTDEPFLPVGTQCVFMNRIWDLDQDSDLPVGQVPIVQAEYHQDERWTLPPLAFSGHMCHPEWFSVGEPWPVPLTLPPTKYLQGWIPECCVVCCEFIGCSLDPVNAAPASQWRQYAIPAKDAVATTPFVQSQVGDAVADIPPTFRGWTWSYHPLGTTAPRVWERRVIADGAGALAESKEVLTFASDNDFGVTVAPDKVTWRLRVGGVDSELTFSSDGTAGELCGTNLKLCAALLPAGVQDRQTAGYVAAGTTLATATPITTTGAQCIATNTLHGVRLPTLSLSGNRILSVVHLNASPVASLRVWPAGGQSIGGLGADLPVALARGSGMLLVEACGPSGDWARVNY